MLQRLHLLVATALVLAIAMDNVAQLAAIHACQHAGAVATDHVEAHAITLVQEDVTLLHQGINAN